MWFERFLVLVLRMEGHFSEDGHSLIFTVSSVLGLRFREILFVCSGLLFLLLLGHPLPFVFVR